MPENDGTETLDTDVAAEGIGGIPSRLDNFVIDQLLGEGAFGAVFAATDVLTERKVSLKILKPNRARAKSADMLLNEARKAAALAHENIVGIHQVVVKGDGYGYIVMQYVDGKDLAAVIKSEGPLPYQAAANVVVDVASGLACAHEKGILHLDVKPSNILISKTGRALLTDFGMAIHDREKWTCSSGGTLAYMAPEQIQRWTQQFDGRTDIWALGVVLYEMLTKKRPFTGGGEPNAIDRLVTEIMQVSPRPPSQWNPDVPHLFDKICLKCLRRDIEERYASATQFREAVRDASKELEDTKTTVGKFFPRGMPSGGHLSGRRKLIAQGCLIVAGLATGIMLLAMRMLRNDEFRDFLRRLLKNLEF